MKALAASRRPKAEEVGVVRNLLLSLLSADVDCHWHALTVGVVNLQRSVLALLRALLVHKAGGGIADGEEAVVVLAHTVAVARERVHEELQLVVGSLGYVNAQAAEGVLDVVGAFLYVRTLVHHYRKVVVAIDELLALPCDNLLHLLDVLHSHLVGRARYAGMTVLLLVEQTQFLLLAWNEYHLVEDDGLRLRHAVDGTHEVNRHGSVVHLDVGVGAYEGGKSDAVDIHEGVHLAAAFTHRDGLVIHLEPGHGDDRVGEVHGEVAVNILARLIFSEQSGAYASVLELVKHLACLHHEVPPATRVVGEKLALLVLLRDDKIGGRVGVFTPFEILEVTVRKELSLNVFRVVEAAAREDVLLLDGIALAERLDDGCQQCGELIVGIGVGRVFLHRVLHTDDRRVFAGLGVEHSHAVHVLCREVDVLKNPLALAACAESQHGDAHAGENRHEYEDNG